MTFRGSGKSHGWCRGVQDRGEISWHTSTAVYHPSAACHPWMGDVLYVGGSSRSRFCPGLS